MTTVYDNVCALAYKAKNQVSTAIESLESQVEVKTPDLTAVDEALRPLGDLDRSIFDQLTKEDGNRQVGKKLALALNRQQRQNPISEIPDTVKTAPTELNNNNALEILAPLLTTFDRLFALKVELTKKFPNKHGNPFPGPDQINSHINLGVELVRNNVNVVLEQTTKATRTSILETIAKKYEYGVAMVRDLTYFLN